MRVIIQGCGRSGTSILGELFEHLPLFEYYFEPHLEDLDNEILKGQQNIAIKVPKGGGVLTSGLACNMDKLINLIGDDYKLLWIVRNPLDTICSLKPGIEDGWSHNPKPPEYFELLDEPWYIKASYHWLYINNQGFSSLKKFGKVHVVRFEDLINKSSEAIEELLYYLGLNISIKSLQPYVNKISNKVKDSYHAKNQVYWFRDNHKNRVGRYKENLNNNQINEILEIVNPIAIKFDYQLSDN